MGWMAGYHNTLGDRHYEHRDTWSEAHDVMVEELDQRVMGLQDGGDYDRDELQDLIDALHYFVDLEPGEDAAADASGLTFCLMPEVGEELAIFAEALSPEVRQ